MTRSSGPARVLGAVVALVATAALSSCVEVPREGPVVTAGGTDQGAPAEGPVYNPPPPTAGAEPDDIVTGFLEAMAATPLRPGPAKAYLTTEAEAQWRPRQVLVYGGHTPPLGRRHVVVDLRGADLIGATGRWRGPASADAARVGFPMAKEDGEWRIAKAPDALILRRKFYEQNYTSQDTSQSTALYNFDPTGRILVPEPVHVPAGSQLATALVKGLIRGPVTSLSGVERTYFPAGLSVLVSVAVDHSVAEVSLNGADPGPLSEQTTQKMLAQLAWTLRQDPSINAFTLTVVDQVVTDSSGASRFPVRAPEFDRYDPAGRASGQTYALRRDRLVSGPLNHPTKVIGPFGTEPLGIGPFAVSLDSLTVAAVGRRALRIGPVLFPGQSVVVQSGAGLLRPAWDSAKRAWEVQNAPDGASVDYFVSGHRHSVDVRGVTGQSVRRFLVSRDGSRFIAVLRGPSTDRIVVSRIRYDSDGRVTGTSRAVPIEWASAGTSRIRDIGWTTPTTIAVLDQVSASQGEVRILNVDGSTRARQVSPIAIQGQGRYLFTSPGGETAYVVQSSQSSGLALANISPAETNRTLQIPRLHHLTYAG
jgi:hypothetical protein